MFVIVISLSRVGCCFYSISFLCAVKVTVVTLFCPLSGGGYSGIDWWVTFGGLTSMWLLCYSCCIVIY